MLINDIIVIMGKCSDNILIEKKENRKSSYTNAGNKKHRNTSKEMRANM